MLLASGTLAGLAYAAGDARSQATAILATLDTQPEAKRVATDSITKAQSALKRADQMRRSGDQKHAALLEETALEWATAAQLLDKAARAEKELALHQTKTIELETKVFRAQALVEQTMARRSRAEEALHKLDDKGAKP
jgi:hypothetical protein